MSEDPIFHSVHLKCSSELLDVFKWMSHNLHAYTYTDNNPVKYRDPSGLITECAQEAIYKFVKCAATMTAAVSFGMDLAIAACAFTGAGFVPCATAVLIIAEGPEIVALTACYMAAHNYYDDCKKKCN
ncbi:MAG: hypothetical protein P8Y85_05040 [Nitrospirota bacterium]